MKTSILTIFNSLLLIIIAPTFYESYIIAGYKNETILTAFLGLIIGTILAIKYQIRKVYYWVGLGIAIFSIFFIYRQQLMSNYIEHILAYFLILLLLIFFISLSYIVAYFELFIVKQFSNKE